LGFIVNVVMDLRRNVAHVVAGDMVAAHRRGCEFAMAVHSVRLPREADIVVADGYPFDIEFWQANKALDQAAHAVRRGGVAILVSPCYEGFSATHRDMLDFGYGPVSEIRAHVAAGRIKNKVAAVHMMQVSRVARERAHVVLVTSGIPEADVRRAGLDYAPTPRAARQGAFVMAQVTPGQSEALFEELGGMQPSRSSLDRLPKEVSPHWEAHRQEWEAALRQQETVPVEAKVLVMSVDGVTVRMKGGQSQAKREQPGKHASGPAGHKEVGCGTVGLYDAEGERLQTVRYGRMPERNKKTLQDQLETEVASVVAVRPDLKRVLLSDGATDNWRLLAEVDQACGPAPEPSVEIVDFCHACDHLKEGCDAA
jgi:hypothetical protein